MQPNTLLPANRVLALLIRHGRTKLNNPKAPRLRAWEDVPLTDDGKLDMQMAANKAKIYRPKIIYSSDLDRDTEGAFIMAGMLGNIPYQTDFALRTANVGVLSGMAEKDVMARVLRWYQTPDEPAPSGESFNQFARRLWRFYDPKLELAREVPSFRPTVFLTHGRVIGYLDSYYRGIPPEDALMPLPGGIAVVRGNTDGMDTLEFLTDTEAVQRDV